MSAALSPAADLARLRQHVAWLHAVLHRLADAPAIGTAFDPIGEGVARMDYARRALAASHGRDSGIGTADRAPSLSALIVGQALVRAPEEQASIDASRARADLAGKKLLSVAWCDFGGRIQVDLTAPADEVELATGEAHVLWHWIDEMAVRGQGCDGPVWFVPGFKPADGLHEKAAAAQRFAAALEQAGRTVAALLAPPAEEVA